MEDRPGAEPEVDAVSDAGQIGSGGCVLAPTAPLHLYCSTPQGHFPSVPFKPRTLLCE